MKRFIYRSRRQKVKLSNEGSGGHFVKMTGVVANRKASICLILGLALSGSAWVWSAERTVEKRKMATGRVSSDTAVDMNRPRSAPLPSQSASDSPGRPRMATGRTSQPVPVRQTPVASERNSAPRRGVQPRSQPSRSAAQSLDLQELQQHSRLQHGVLTVTPEARSRYQGQTAPATMPPAALTMETDYKQLPKPVAVEETIEPEVLPAAETPVISPPAEIVTAPAATVTPSLTETLSPVTEDAQEQAASRPVEAPVVSAEVNRKPQNVTQPREARVPRPVAAKTPVADVVETIPDPLNTAIAAPPPTTPDPTQSETVQKKGWHLAPVSHHLGGELSYNFRRQQIDDSDLTTQYLDLNLRGSANSFIWQPWFARLRGTAVAGLRKNISSERADSVSALLSGNGTLTVLPVSRFPFEAYISRNHNDYDVEDGIGSFYKTTGYGLAQRYRPRSGGPRLVMKYDYEEWESTDEYHGEQDVVKLGMTHEFGSQWLDLGGEVERTRRSTLQDERQVKNLTGLHHYRPGSGVSVETLADLTEIDFEQDNGQSTVQAYSQLNTSAFWRPDDKPMTINTSMRLYQLDTSSSINPNADYTVNSVNANVGTRYELTKRLRLNASANANMNDNGSRQLVTTNQNLGALYQADVLDLWGFNYSRSLSGKVTNQTNDATDENSQIFTLSPRHMFNRSIRVGEGNIGLRYGQSGLLKLDSRDERTLDIIHTGSVGWSRSGNINSMVSLSASDSRAVIGDTNVFQLINLQASLNDQIDRDSSWDGSLTLQATRQQTFTTPVTENVTASADLGYRHYRVFNVPRLRFHSNIRITGDALAPQLVSTTQEERLSWDNRLDYSIGKTRFRLTGRVAEVSKIRESLLWFNVIRRF